jgi:hypothetical protein
VVELHIQIHNVFGVGQTPIQSGVGHMLWELLLNQRWVRDQEPVDAEGGLEGVGSIDAPARATCTAESTQGDQWTMQKVQWKSACDGLHSIKCPAPLVRKRHQVEVMLERDMTAHTTEQSNKEVH